MEQAIITAVSGIPVTAEPGVDLAVATTAKQFTNWLASVDLTKFTIKSVHFQSVDMFGATKVGFVKFRATVVDKNDRPVNGIVFARGGAVAVLALFECEGKTHVVVTVQPRVPVGKFDFVEICAGMLDGSGNFGGVAAKELKEELDIELSEDDLTDLTELAGYSGGFFLSPGACEETIRLYAFRKQVTREELNAMEGKCTGALEENEQITLKIIGFDDLLTLPDAKSIVAHALYTKFAAQVKLI
jgi:ADP-sugar diphosphatase